MVNIDALQECIKDSGMTVTAIADKANMERTTFYNRLKGIGEFTASEIVGITKALRLSKTQRDEIFLSNELN